LGSLSEPHRKQNLYANPKRTAKFSPAIHQTLPPEKGSINFQKTFAANTNIDT
jgi:hypothetical protein